MLIGCTFISTMVHSYCVVAFIPFLLNGVGLVKEPGYFPGIQVFLIYRMQFLAISKLPHFPW